MLDWTAISVFVATGVAIVGWIIGAHQARSSKRVVAALIAGELNSLASKAGAMWSVLPHSWKSVEGNEFQTFAQDIASEEVKRQRLVSAVGSLQTPVLDSVIDRLHYLAHSELVALTKILRRIAEIRSKSDQVVRLATESHGDSRDHYHAADLVAEIKVSVEALYKELQAAEECFLSIAKIDPE
ncbi:hypothetical protein LK996_15645 [Lysobacter sp. A6]|uniref:Uncharacterized protein n=1 Tax=Noviluteimonas lactosilytica TaxID=2888523 RepID=A0ABS8JLL1_9GAMM|nr:hypothetical protein [Lysobacter lactosilyticus]MCC8364505.1 hypothetical protein [Lysobacter lactosilyticus]